MKYPNTLEQLMSACEHWIATPGKQRMRPEWQTENDIVPTPQLFLDLASRIIRLEGEVDTLKRRDK